MKNVGDMDTALMTEIIQSVESVTKTPEDFVSIQENLAPDLRQLTKKLYDFNKQNDLLSPKDRLRTLDELVLNNLDEEQIWQQIELQNNFICQDFISDIAQFLVKKDKLILGSKNEDEGDDDDVDDDDEEFGEEGDNTSELNDEEGNEESEGDEERDYGEYVSEPSDGDEDGGSDVDAAGKEPQSKCQMKRSVVDDKFFKLHEMERFLEKEEKPRTHRGGDESDEDNSDDESIDYFEKMSSASSGDEDHAKYSDFFDEPENATVKKRKKKEKGSKNYEGVDSRKKRVKFAFDEDEDDENNEDEDEGSDSDEEEDEEKQTKKSDTISTFEARQERLKSRIKALEEEALKEKPWQLKGEVTGTNRPQNSLLEEYIEFDAAVRPPPVITEKSTLKLEDIIKQRIKDKAFDDVERKVKPVENPREYKKRLVLDQEKSKLSLAQIYEQEYLKQKEMKMDTGEEKPEETPQEHAEIDKMMKSLFNKLDALSNFHFTPKMVSAEIKIISNAPAVTVEEVAPTATSDAALLAPEEIKPKTKGDFLGKTERTKTDKKRERRLKKKKQGLRQKEAERKENMEKQASSKKVSKSAKVSKKMLKKLSRTGNVTQMKANGDGKYVKSSNAFFSKLQDEVKSHIKTKTSKSFEKDRKFDAKKLKL